MAPYALDEFKHIPQIIYRLKHAVAEDMQRIVSPMTLLLAGLNAEYARIRTLLWAIAIDALLMAANRSEFSARLHVLLGSDTLVFPPSRDGSKPGYTVAELSESLYDYRSDVAHGRRISGKFLVNTGFLDGEGNRLILDFTWEQVLEEAALFLLRDSLKLVLTPGLFLDIPKENIWRQRLKSRGGD